MRSTDKKRDNKVLMSLRISIEEKEQIEEKARKTGLTTSEYIRRCALGRKLPCYGDTSLLKEYSMQLGKTGSNLNQIAKHLNSGGSYLSVYSDVKEAVNELLDLKFKILPALEDVVCGRKRRRKIEKDGEA
ncbi:MAG: plasmid mobilization relaxosome protein MobC [Lachnospiraceae bacterium]|nr:plasmid mobilization relaxosome protein MobC [Lachnospiraceae bacterium]